MFDLIIATAAHQINLSLMRNGNYGGATIANYVMIMEHCLLLN